jgi:hypothetical protein
MSAILWAWFNRNLPGVFTYLWAHTQVTPALWHASHWAIKRWTPFSKNSEGCCRRKSRPASFTGVSDCYRRPLSASWSTHVSLVPLPPQLRDIASHCSNTSRSTPWHISRWLSTLAKLSAPVFHRCFLHTSISVHDLQPLMNLRWQPSAPKTWITERWSCLDGCAMWYAISQTACTRRWISADWQPSAPKNWITERWSCLDGCAMWYAIS